MVFMLAMVFLLHLCLNIYKFISFLINVYKNVAHISKIKAKCVQIKYQNVTHVLLGINKSCDIYNKNYTIVLYYLCYFLSFVKYCW